MTQQGAHASKLVVAGREYRIRRTFELGCRIEERFGPLLDLAEKLERARLTFREHADLTAILLSGVEDPPDAAAIEAHLVRAGVMKLVAEAHPIITVLFLGEERFMKRVADQGKRPPQPSADISTGEDLLVLRDALDGHLRNSGPPPSTNSRQPYPPASETGRPRE